MTPQTDDHTLNACLARVIGVEIFECQFGAEWTSRTGWGYGVDGRIEEWDPIQNASQMEEVEAWLKQEGIEFVITSVHLCNLMIVELILANGIFEGKDPDKKRAFALAIWEMEHGKS